MTPSPVQNCLKPRTNGTVIAAQSRGQVAVAEQDEPVPGDRAERGQGQRLVQRSSAAPAPPGRPLIRPDSASPHPTAAESTTIATIPSARLASQNRCWLGSVSELALTPPPPRLELVADRAERLDRPVVGEGDPAPARQPPLGAAGPDSSAAFASASASTAVGATAVAWTRPVHAGLPVAGSIR